MSRYLNKVILQLEGRGGEGLCYYMLTKILVMLASPGSIETGKTILRDKKTAGSCVFHKVF